MGTSTPTRVEIQDIRDDLARLERAFTDAEIERRWARCASATTQFIQHDATLALLARAIVSGSVKLHDYTTGNTSEKLSQDYDHAKALYAEYKAALDKVSGKNAIAVGAAQPGRAPDELPPEYGFTDKTNGAVWLENIPIEDL